MFLRTVIKHLQPLCIKDENHLQPSTPKFKDPYTLHTKLQRFL